MAEPKRAPGASRNSSKLSVQELRDFYDKHERRTENFAKVQKVVQMLDLTKTQSRTFSTYSKETLRNYMKNPKQNESKLRNLSRFLWRVSHSYRRLLAYNAQQVDLTAISVAPLIDLTQDNDPKTILKDYYDTCVELEKMKLATEIYKCLIIAWREDAFFGYVYEDNSGFFIYPLDGDYCKISSTNYDGTCNFAYDFSYFRRHSEELEFWDSEFNSKYTAYQGDNNLRWQELDSNRTICLKVNDDDPTLCLAPYSGLFESIIDNVDLQSILAVKNQLSIYKLLVARMNHMSGSNDPNEFEVDPDTAMDYYERLADSVPDCVGTAISPLPIDVIEFKPMDTSDVDMITTSMSNLFKQSGGSMVLNDEHTGATIYRAHIIADMMNALKPLLGQIEKWTNHYLKSVLSNPAQVSYIYTSPWMKNEKKKELLESAQYGVPVKMAVAALDGFSPLQVLSLQFLENKVLDLPSNWIPLNSSYTTSGTDEGGGQEKDEGELGDEGEQTKEKEKNQM